jgi:flagellar protein FlaJ
MNIDAINGNIDHMKEIVREMYIFSNQLTEISRVEQYSGTLVNPEEKKLLNEAIYSLGKQLKILNNSIPNLIENIGFYQKLPNAQNKTPEKNEKKLIQVSYNRVDKKEKVSLAISDEDKKDFLENLSKSNLSINQLKRKYGIQKPIATFGKSSGYARMSNYFFRKISNKLVSKGYFNSLNGDLRKMNSPFIVSTYVSMILFSVLLTAIFALFLFILLLFFNLSLLFPFLSITEQPILTRFINFFWIIFAIPLGMGTIMYFYPSSEGKSLGARIDQELAFVTIHMSAIATSGVEPTSIFKVILKSGEYKNTNMELTKLINLVNFHGKDLVTALRIVSKSSPSQKLKELLDGMATTFTSGGNLKDFLSKHSETLLFDYKLEREKYTKTSETFMDIYISIVIAAPMIFIMLFVIMGSTGVLSTFIGLGTEALNLLIIMAIVTINVGFLIFLKLKQPII